MYKIFAPLFFFALPCLGTLTMYSFALVFGKISEKLDKIITGSHQNAMNLIISFFLTLVIYAVAFLSVVSVPHYIEYNNTKVEFLDVTPNVRPGEEARIILKGKPEENYNLLIYSDEYNEYNIKTNTDGIAKHIYKVPTDVETEKCELTVESLEDKEETDYSSFTIVK